MNRLAKTGHKGFPNAFRGCALAALLLGLAGSSSMAQTTEAAAKPMVLPWIADVVKMSAAGVPQDVIQVYVKNSSAHSTLTPDDIVYLRDKGVATGVINTMIEHGASQPMAVATAAPVAQPQYMPQPSPYAPVPQSYAPAPQYSDQPADYSDQPSSSVYDIANSSPSNPYYYSYPYYSYPYWYYYPSIYYTGSRVLLHGLQELLLSPGGFHGRFPLFSSPGQRRRRRPCCRCCSRQRRRRGVPRRRRQAIIFRRGWRAPAMEIRFLRGLLPTVPPAPAHARARV